MLHVVGCAPPRPRCATWTRDPRSAPSSSSSWQWQYLHTSSPCSDMLPPGIAGGGEAGRGEQAAALLAARRRRQGRRQPGIKRAIKRRRPAITLRHTTLATALTSGAGLGAAQEGTLTGKKALLVWERRWAVSCTDRSRRQQRKGKRWWRHLLRAAAQRGCVGQRASHVWQQIQFVSCLIEQSTIRDTLVLIHGRSNAGVKGQHLAQEAWRRSDRAALAAAEGSGSDAVRFRFASLPTEVLLRIMGRAAYPLPTWAPQMLANTAD